MSGQAIQQRPSDSLAGTYSDPREVNRRMQEAMQQCHLVSPATSVGQLPEGCGIALTVVTVDIANDTYPTDGGKRGLSKTKLQQIGHAVGMSWDPIASGRLDDGSHPHFCHWRAVGSYKSFDGQIQTVVGEKVMDLRDGSAQIANKTAAGIAQMRQHIHSHAETKAQLRATRALGIKTAYTDAELQKPFVACRVQFNGQTNDPELRREFARMTAQHFLSGQKALYAQAPTAPGSEPPPAPSRLMAPPPVGTVRDEDDDLPGSYREAAGEPVRQNAQAPASSGQRSGITIPGGNSKGTPIEDASDRDLEYWSNRIAGDLAEGKSRNPSRDAPMQKAMADELAKRQGAGPGGEY